MYLQRSQGVPIDVDILIDYNVEVSSRIIRFFDIIMPHLARCRTIRVSMASTQGLRYFFPFVGPFPFLESMNVTLLEDLYYHQSCIKYFEMPIPFMTGSAGRLRSMAVSADPSYWITLDKMQTPSLVIADIDTGSAMGCMVFAKSCPALRELVIDVGAEGAMLNDGHDLALSSLESFVLNGTHTYTRLSSFFLPNLLHLSIHGPVDLQDAVFPSLISLTVQEPDMESKSLGKFIRSHPNLVALQLLCESSTADVLYNMSGPNTLCTSTLRLIRLIKGSDRRGGMTDLLPHALQYLLERNPSVSIEWRGDKLPRDLLPVQASHPERMVLQTKAQGPLSDQF